MQQRLIRAAQFGVIILLLGIIVWRSVGTDERQSAHWSDQTWNAIIPGITIDEAREQLGRPIASGVIGDANFTHHFFMVEPADDHDVGYYLLVNREGKVVAKGARGLHEME